jgi:hypothetical protein
MGRNAANGRRSPSAASNTTRRVTRGDGVKRVKVLDCGCSFHLSQFSTSTHLIPSMITISSTMMIIMSCMGTGEDGDKSKNELVIELALGSTYEEEGILFRGIAQLEEITEKR